MIGSLRIQNFKSIRDLALQPKRVNLFIGEPNTGKSNILEALAFFSPGTVQAFQEILRFQATADLFFDQKVSEEITIQAGEWVVALGFKEGSYQGEFLWRGNPPDTVAKGSFHLDHKSLVSWSQPKGIPAIRYYQFKPLVRFPNGQPGLLNSPFGDNLAAVLYSNEALRQRVGGIVRSRGFRLQLKPAENELLIAKDVNDEIYSYPWTGVSETLRRVVFLMAVLETNQNSTLLLDEPEANTFPFYTKYLAERIALDETNQFFITTHNPYLLSSIVEKTLVKELSVFVSRMENYQTVIKPVPEKNLAELLELDSDAFFNLERLVAE